MVPLVVVVDTNFLAVPAQFGIDIFTEAERILERRIEYHIIESVLEEIERRHSTPRDGKERRIFSVARQLVKHCKIIKICTKWQKLPVDDQLIKYAEHVKGVLATNDGELRKKARFSRVPVLFLRGKKRLDIDGTIL